MTAAPKWESCDGSNECQAERHLHGCYSDDGSNCDHPSEHEAAAAHESRSVALEVKYELGHSYNEKWHEEPWHCPACGVEPVWVNSGAGDYYEGPQHICQACGWTWTMPRIEESAGWQDEQRLAAIREVTK